MEKCKSKKCWKKIDTKIVKEEAFNSAIDATWLKMQERLQQESMNADEMIEKECEIEERKVMQRFLF